MRRGFATLAKISQTRMFSPTEPIIRQRSSFHKVEPSIEWEEIQGEQCKNGVSKTLPMESTCEKAIIDRNATLLYKTTHAFQIQIH